MSHKQLPVALVVSTGCLILHWPINEQPLSIRAAAQRI